jgi:hypothetical protein
MRINGSARTSNVVPLSITIACAVHAMATALDSEPHLCLFCIQILNYSTGQRVPSAQWCHRRRPCSWHTEDVAFALHTEVICGRLCRALKYIMGRGTYALVHLLSTRVPRNPCLYTKVNSAAKWRHCSGELHHGYRANCFGTIQSSSLYNCVFHGLMNTMRRIIVIPGVVIEDYTTL